MSGIIVVHELDGAVRARTARGTARAVGEAVRRVHAAPAAPGTTTEPGPRTLCGRDTFAMEAVPWKPSEQAGSPWYPPDEADLACPACNAAMDDG
ncbi:hypothetical protein ABZZ20_35005 [Streptomyces sp. NPDC006430]|uniref:hypothetical protein n=1 Tax=Streptomyces sp. NPDC006430 TaxID=3154299 RepID=UPI0033BF6B8D